MFRLAAIFVLFTIGAILGLGSDLKMEACLLGPASQLYMGIMLALELARRAAFFPRSETALRLLSRQLMFAFFMLEGLHIGLDYGLGTLMSQVKEEMAVIFDVMAVIYLSQKLFNQLRHAIIFYKEPRRKSALKAQPRAFVKVSETNVREWAQDVAWTQRRHRAHARRAGSIEALNTTAF